MAKGRRILRFWIFLFLTSGTGCAGCGNCFEVGVGDSGCDLCDGGDCALLGEGYDASTSYDAAPPPGYVDIVENIAYPAGIASDGTNVFYIDNASLFAANRTSPGTAPVLIATDVYPAGEIVVDDTYVYWASIGFTIEDGGTDAGDDADEDGGDEPDTDGGDDAGDDAGDAGGILPTRGIFRVAKVGGPVEYLGDLEPLPGIALSDGNLFLDARGGDGGIVGVLPIDGDAGFTALAPIGLATATRAIAPVGSGIAFIDDFGIEFFDLADGGSATLIPNTGASAIVSTASVPFFVAPTGSSNLIESVENDAGTNIPFDVGDVTSFGQYVYIADTSGFRVIRYDTTALGLAPTVISASTSQPLMLAGDSLGVCWIEGQPSASLVCTE